ncbi:hypothetical protein ACV1D6_11015, partial [Aeromonas veronii]
GVHREDRLSHPGRTDAVNPVLVNRYSYLDSNIFENIWPKGLNVGSLNDIISAIADACQLSLRSTEKLIDRSLLVFVNMKDDSINIVFLAYLIALHEIKLSDYETIISLERSHSFIPVIKLNEIKLHGMNNISGTVSIKMENDCNGAFRQGVYQVPIRDLVRNYLLGYLGEYQNIDSKLKNDVKEFDEKYKSMTAEVFSEKLKEGVLNSCLRKKSRVDMSIYRDLVELAISFE